MREVAAVDGGGGAIEIANGVGDGAVEANRHDEGDELEDGEERCKDKQQVTDEGADEDGGAEEMRVKQCRTRSNIDQAGELLATSPRGGGERRGKSDVPIEQEGGGGQLAATHGAGGLLCQLLPCRSARRNASGLAVIFRKLSDIRNDVDQAEALGELIDGRKIERGAGDEGDHVTRDGSRIHGAED